MDKFVGLVYDDTGNELLWDGEDHDGDGVAEEPSYTNDDSGDEEDADPEVAEDADGDVRIGFENKWYKELLSMPENIDYDASNEAAENMTQCEPVVGIDSGYAYYCQEEFGDYYTVYFNITQDQESARMA